VGEKGDLSNFSSEGKLKKQKRLDVTRKKKVLRRQGLEIAYF